MSGRLDVGTNGNMTMSGSSNVYGTLSSPWPAGPGDCKTYALTDSSSGGIAEGVIPHDPITFDDPEPITPAPPTTDLTISSACSTTPGCTVLGKHPVTGRNQWALAPGTYGNIKMSGGDLIFSAGIYNLNGITQFSGGAQLHISSGPVRINVNGKKSDGSYLTAPISMSGGGVWNTTNLPSNLAFVYGEPGSITMSGGSGAYMAVYAPNAPITVSGDGDIFGSIVGSTFTASGGSSIHYDGQLRNTFVLRFTWVPTSFSRDKY